MYNGEKIREILRDKGIKNKKLLEYMGWKGQNQLKQTIEGNPSAETLERICDFLEIPIDTLFTRSDYNNKTDVEKLQEQVIEQQKQTIDSLHALLAVKQ